MAVTVVDSTNLAQIVAEATGETIEAPAADPAPAADAPNKGEADKPNADTPAEGATKTDPEQDDADDVEGEDGLTERQKRELSAKMLKAIGKKHRQIKEAEEFAADQIRLQREASQRAEALERELQELRAKQKPAQEQQTQVEPKREDFATEGEYWNALTDWKVDQKLAAKEAERQKQEAQTRMQSQFARAAELVPDFEATVAKQLTYPPVVVEYMQGSDMFAELGYHFAKNPTELERIGKMIPVRQLVAVGEIKAKLQPFAAKPASQAPAAKAGDTPTTDGKATQAVPSTTDTGFSPSKARSDAPVIKPISSSERAQVEIDPSEMTTRQMIEDFQRKKGVNLHARKRH